LRRPTVVGAVGVAVVIVAALFAGIVGYVVYSTRSVDERRYPSGMNVTLEWALSRYDLDLPDCASGVRYAVTVPTEGLILTFRAESDCVGRFLASVGADDGPSMGASHVPFPIRAGEWGLNVDPKARFDSHRGTTLPGVSIEVFVEITDGEGLVYVSGIRR
jgi:hypothetical protein